MSIKFYYTPQSNADRIHGSLQALGIPYEEVRIDLRAGDQRKPEFLKLNPNGMVPTIVIDGTPMFESVAIQIALGERYGVEKGLWPALDSGEHLTAITWLVWAQVNLGAAIMRYAQHTSEWFAKDKQDPAQAEVAMGQIKALLAILDGHLEGRDFLTGSRFTLADLDVGGVLGWGLMMAKIDMSAYPNTAAWMQRNQQKLGIGSAS